MEDLLKKFGLDLKFCVGFGVDSCSVNTSEVKGAVHELKKVAKNAERCPCTSHALNNALAQSSTVVPCRLATGIMKKISAFARASPKRFDVFKRKLGSSIQGLCETRWVERHGGF